MKILVTGAKGFVGKNLCSQLKNIKDAKAKWYNLPEPIDAVYEYDIDSSLDDLDAWCRDCDFVFNLAGVNRPQDPKEFMEGNFGFATVLLDTLKKYNNNCPVMISSSIQATLAGRFGTSEYGKSKKAGEELMFKYGEETGAKVLVYRFPNLFGKWCRPNYNSAIATFCNNIANDLPIQVNDRSVEMELLYIDDLVDEMIGALRGESHRCEFDGVETVPAENGRYCYVPVTHKTTLGEIVDIINECAQAASNVGGINMMELPQGSLRYKLMTTYLSYLPKEKAIYDLKMNVDPRGSFTELVHSLNCGQVSINIS
ncbi:MAG: NAD-dependent epimerase/dehydratase family protein, partial [Paludibacteraceae bacterium]|nr:NAD-dependent epimerase/dehydratase family protein [Paludibacteraceae bacterium]